MRRRLILRWSITLSAMMLLMAAYVATPFLTAWQLREAIRNGDSRTVAGMVEWEPVRASLKASLAKHAELLPAATAAGAAVQPTWWQRIKGALGQTMLDRFVETYVTPEGLTQLFAYRETYREYVKGEDLTAEKSKPWIERLVRFSSRVKRAEFQGLSRVVVEIEDRQTSERRYLSAFERSGLAWKLVHLEVLGTPTAPAVGRGSEGASLLPAPALPAQPLLAPTAELSPGAAADAMPPLLKPRLRDYARAAWTAAKDAAQNRWSGS